MELTQGKQTGLAPSATAYFIPQTVYFISTSLNLQKDTKAILHDNEIGMLVQSRRRWVRILFRLQELLDLGLLVRLVIFQAPHDAAVLPSNERGHALEVEPLVVSERMIACSPCRLIAHVHAHQCYWRLALVHCVVNHRLRLHTICTHAWTDYSICSIYCRKGKWVREESTWRGDEMVPGHQLLPTEAMRSPKNRTNNRPGPCTSAACKPTPILKRKDRERETPTYNSSQPTPISRKKVRKWVSTYNSSNPDVCVPFCIAS